MKIEILHIFQTAWGISMTFSGKMWLMIIEKSQKIKVSPFVKKIHFLKNHSKEGGGSNWPLSRFSVKTQLFIIFSNFSNFFLLVFSHIFIRENMILFL